MHGETGEKQIAGGRFATANKIKDQPVSRGLANDATV